jgi:hypothetical protein
LAGGSPPLNGNVDPLLRFAWAFFGIVLVHGFRKCLHLTSSFIPDLLDRVLSVARNLERTPVKVYGQPVGEANEILVAHSASCGKSATISTGAPAGRHKPLRPDSTCDLCRSLRELGSIYDVNPQLRSGLPICRPQDAGFYKEPKRPNGGPDAAARFHESLAGSVMMRNTLPPLASNDFWGETSDSHMLFR